MAKGTDIQAQCSAICNDVVNGVYKPVYLLMGDEPYYPDMVCKAIMDNCVDESFKDFNEVVLYGADVEPDQVVSAARQYPMMSERLLVVLKEAQLMKNLEELAVYCEDPLDSTVLVIVMHKASADKRKSLYKSAQKFGVVVDSPAVRDYELPGWISSYYASRGLEIDPQAAALLAESTGTDLAGIVAETDKMVRNLPQGTTRISVDAVERNVGINRQFSVFELTRELSARNTAKAMRIARHIASAPKFFMPMAISALYTHFYRILKLETFIQQKGYPDPSEKAKLLGVNPYFFREYDQAVRNFPIETTKHIISLLVEYDFKSKGGEVGSADDVDLMTELISKILN